MSKISTRIKLMIARAIIKAVDDTGEIQLAKTAVYGDELPDGVEHIQHYGFTSVPPVGSEAIVAYVGSNKDNGVMICSDSGEHRHSGLADGESSHYSMHGQRIHMKNDGDIDVACTKTNFGSGSDFVAMAALVDAKFQSILNAITAATPTATDGGAALKTSILAALNADPAFIGNVQSSNVKADQ